MSKYSRITVQKKEVSKESAKSSTQSVTKAEIELLRQKIAEKIDQSPAKAAKIFENWLKNDKKSSK